MLRPSGTSEFTKFQGVLKVFQALKRRADIGINKYSDVWMCSISSLQVVERNTVGEGCLCRRLKGVV